MDPLRSRRNEDNLTTLVELNETTLLQSIRKRYAADSIYTDVGDILVAVNPFKQLSIYSEDWSGAYGSGDVNSLSPHIYSVAARAFNALQQSKKNQVCVISGESGAGKTESTKFIIQQLMRICKSSQLGTQLQNKIIQLNPVLEAFGNAKTLLNDNSSRFGKFIQLMFTPHGRIVGAGLDQYLLEKSRVCMRGDEERNYHIFYYLFAGMSSEEVKQLQLENPESHRYMHSYKNLMTDSRSKESRDAFLNVTQSMKEIGFLQEEIEQVLTTLAAILHIGDIDFKCADSNDDSSVVVNMEKVHLVSRLLMFDSPDDLSFALTTLRTTTRDTIDFLYNMGERRGIEGETVDKLYSPSKSADVRDAMSKALYSRMFHWLVSRINNYLLPHETGQHLGIGILDIFGFENFHVNSFEQVCINLANEQLQQYFNTQIFAMEKEEYVKEGISGVDISFQDNQPVLELFLTRPVGLISLLDEQCRTNGNEKSLMERYRQRFDKHPNYEPHKGNALVFTVKHYAGKVEYQASGFLDKNRDSLPEPVQGVLKFSSLRLVRTLFTKYPNFSGAVLQPTSRIRPSQRSVMRKMSVRKRKQSIRKGGKVITVSGHFRESLQKLMERILPASPHFIRCIKPNSAKIPQDFDNEFVLKQLKYTGMLETVRVRREGFAYRPFFSDFVTDYRQIAFKFTDKSVRSSQETCQKILTKSGITGWKMGRSRVFLRYYHEEKLNIHLLDMDKKATLIQKIYRGCIARRKYGPLREAAKKQKVVLKEMLKQISQTSEDSFSRVVELNKTDIMLAIERFGHPNQARTAIPTKPQKKEDEKKFRPKAIGAVAVLVNGPIDKERILKPNRKISKDENKNPPNSPPQSIDTPPTSLVFDEKKTQRPRRPRRTSKDENKIPATSLDKMSPTKEKPRALLPKPKTKPEALIPPARKPRSLVKTNNLMTNLDRRARSVSPSPITYVRPDVQKSTLTRSRGTELHLNGYKNEDPGNYSNDEEYTEMDYDSNIRKNSLPVPPQQKINPVTKNKRPVGGVKILPGDSTLRKQKPQTSIKQSLMDQSPVSEGEYHLTFKKKEKDSITEKQQAPTAGTLVKPLSVKTYTIQTGKNQTNDVHKQPVSKPDLSSDDENEYVYPFVYPTGERQDTTSSDVNSDNTRMEESHEYATISGDRKSSLESSLSKSRSEQQSRSNSDFSKAIFSTRTVGVRDRTTGTRRNLLTGLSGSVPNLLSSSNEDLFSNGEGLTIDTPLLHRISRPSNESPGIQWSSSPSLDKHKKKRFERLFKKNKSKESSSGDITATHEFKYNKPVVGDIDPLGSMEIPGYLPGISDHNAETMLCGQPQGSYLIYTDYSTSGNFIFKLAVSQGHGRRVWSCDIVPEYSSNGNSGLILIGDKGYHQTFTNLKNLATYFKAHPLNRAGLSLTDACLISGGIPQDQLKFAKKKPVPMPRTILRIKK